MPGKKLFFTGLVIAALVISAQGQQGNLDSVAKQFIKKIESGEKDRSIVVTDRSIYRAGERIWFRVFLLRSVSQLISLQSKTLFLDLVDERDHVLTNLFLNAKRTQLAGKIDIPPSLATGFYWLRAYTAEMAKSDRGLFTQAVYIINPFTKDPARNNGFKSKEIQNGDSLLVHFFPEGGNIITGTNSTVALEISDNNHNPVAVTGLIKDNRDSIVAQFTSDKYGLATFEFFPKSFRRYAAHVVANGKQSVYPLPPFNFFAGQLSIIKQESGNRKLRVLLEDSIFKQDYRSYIIGISKDSVCFASQGTGMYEVTIPEQNFPKGIATFYLLDKDFRFLSERSVFIKPNHLLINAALDKPIYSKREKAELTISVADAANNPVLSSLSVAIADTSLVRQENADELMADYYETGPSVINNWSLLTSNELTDHQLDILMLAREISFGSLLANPIDQTSAATESDSLLFIKGIATNSKGTPLQNRIVALFSKTGDILFDTDTTDAYGRFSFPMEEYPDSTGFIIKVSTLQGLIEDASIAIDTLRTQKLNGHAFLKKKFTVNPSAIDDYLKAYNNDGLISGNDKEILKEVNVKANKKRELSYDASKRVSLSSKIVVINKFDKGSPGTVKNAILSAGGFRVIDGFITMGGITGFNPSRRTEPMVVVDGITIGLSNGDMETVSPVLSFLNQLRSEDIDFIEILSGSESANYGVRGGNGVILVNTKAVNDKPSGDHKLNVFMKKGYQNEPPFPTPDYDNAKVKNNNIPDLRSTLFWKGLNVTDPSGKIKCTFFTSDISATYNVIITGVTLQGDLIFKVLQFHTGTQ